MQNRKPIYLAMVILLVFSLILAGMIFYAQKPELKVIFLDVGQGDAILIQHGSNQILIDGGPSEQVLLEKLGRYVPFWDREIEVVMATHPDQDHIQGLMGVLKNYQVKNLIQTTVRNDSQLDKKYQELIGEKNIPKTKGESGLSIKLGEARLDILSPSGSVPDGIVKDTNGYSLVARLVAGESSFLLTGDLPEREELGLIDSGAEMKSTVLKVAHHGSKYSTSNDFLAYVQPKQAVISVGKNNRFGHPAMEALERLTNSHVQIIRTDELGDVKFICPSFQNECTLVAN